MKKQITLTVLIFLWVTALLNAQSLPADFEEWTETTVEQLAEPNDFWHSNNFEADSFFYGGGPVERTSDSYSGDYAIRLETIVDYDGDTIPGFVGCVPEVWGDGVPFSGNPDSLIGYFKCHIMPDDTANIYVNLSRNGSWEGYGSILFSETENTDLYKRFAMKIDTNSNGLLPDSLEIILAGAKYWDGAVPGTWIQFDSLHFKGSELTQNDTLGNHDFERWAVPDSYTYSEPLNWNTYNAYTQYKGDTSFIFKSDEAHSGSSSVSLISDSVTGQMERFGVINMLHNGSFTSSAPSGGLITNQWPDSVVAWCKYSPVGNDSAFFGVINGGADLSEEMPTPQNSSILKIPSTPSFEKFVFDLTSIRTDSSEPDSVLIVISSSNILAGSFEVGSQLWVDDIALYPQVVNAIQVTSANEVSEIYADSTLQMYAEVFPDYALNDSVTWSVDQENVATIDENGLLTGISSGTVTVTATSKDGTDVTGTLDMEVLSETSVIDFNHQQTEISVYPVPAESVIHIASAKAISGSLRLIDITGKTFIETELSESKIKTMDVSGLQSGLYFIQLTMSENTITKKIIIK